jgi:hypothetical protein
MCYILVALHWTALTILDNPICGKDSGLPGPSIVSVKTATRGWTAETMKSHKFVVAPASEGRERTNGRWDAGKRTEVHDWCQLEREDAGL